MTNTDRLYDSLKILGIETEPTDTPERKAWYTRSGEYLGTHGTDDGLESLKKITELARPTENLDAYDHRIGTSLREYRKALAEKWGD